MPTVRGVMRAAASFGSIVNQSSASTHRASLEPFVLSTVVEQRLAICGGAGLHPPHEDGVIALDVPIDRDTLDVGEGTAQERQPERAHAVGDAVELVQPRGREAPRERLVLGGK